MISLPKKLRNDEPNRLRGNNGKQPPNDLDTPSKNRYIGKTQKSTDKKIRPNLYNSMKFDLRTRDIGYGGEKEQFPLDRINLKIIEELITNGDIKSSEIAEKIQIPLSTIQRRRTRIEKAILKKTYQMDLTNLGYRTAQIFVDVQKGKAKETGEELLKKYDRNIVNASTRINSSNNLCLEVVYNGSDELHFLLEEIKALPLATKVDWSEQVTMIGDNLSAIIKNTLADRLDEIQASKILA
ncbi:Lrp/AsnC family transcriptional regulator [Candidatus Nitrosocosmicus hydrocola]|uniref:Lrp/AsnC family transcriptional regulator n=1 Tax=Candidatus Nitrosocosmicus hydrocola TaxID=1826872 RepID=UPI001373285F|nr:Lrp/AsnC family transcriptional regulator [Candidatus Nitrosocosmicus hydrocola]